MILKFKEKVYNFCERIDYYMDLEKAWSFNVSSSAFE
jgi:hypothetical protein